MTRALHLLSVASQEDILSFVDKVVKWAMRCRHSSLRPLQELKRQAEAKTRQLEHIKSQMKTGQVD